MKSPAEIISKWVHDQDDVAIILRDLESNGYKIVQATGFVRTVEAETFNSVDRHTA